MLIAEGHNFKSHAFAFNMRIIDIKSFVVIITH